MEKKICSAVGIIICFVATLVVYTKWKHVTKPVCKNCNVILISVDTLRADELPCYGYSRNTAPNLCAFADKNLTFTNFFSHTPNTLSSHFSIFTSLYPRSHGMQVIYRDILNPKIPTMTELFRARGYRTVFIGPVDDPMLPLTKGLERGFTDIYEGDDNSWDTHYDVLLKNAAAKKPTFMFLHTYAVHAPYLFNKNEKRLFTTQQYPDVPVTFTEFYMFTEKFRSFIRNDLAVRLKEPNALEDYPELVVMFDKFSGAKTLKEAENVFNSFSVIEKNSYYNNYYFSLISHRDVQFASYLQALYDERIFLFDQNLRKLFTFLETNHLLDNTIVTITSDHGEEFNEHGNMLHLDLYNTTTHVPFIMAIPGMGKRVINDLLQSIDIMPTLLSLTGIAKPARFEGIDVSDRLYDIPFASRNRYLVGDFDNQDGQYYWKSIRDSRWKLYMFKKDNTMRKELYDLLRDPKEMQNIASSQAGVVDRLSKALTAIEQSSPGIPKSPFPSWIDPVKRKKLIETGYF